jgi:hypothetical protein
MQPPHSTGGVRVKSGRCDIHLTTLAKEHVGQPVNELHVAPNIDVSARDPVIRESCRNENLLIENTPSARPSNLWVSLELPDQACHCSAMASDVIIEEKNVFGFFLHAIQALQHIMYLLSAMK